MGVQKSVNSPSLYSIRYSVSVNERQPKYRTGCLPVQALALHASVRSCRHYLEFGKGNIIRLNQFCLVHLICLFAFLNQFAQQNNHKPLELL